jgi:copper chaperone CopZ
METIKLAITGMTCGHCVSSVRQALESVPGVQVENVRVGAAELRLDTAAASTEVVLAAVQGAGYEATVDASSASGTQKRDSAGCACCAPSASSAAPTPLSASRDA